MASNDSISRLGRSQGASIFWGMVSVFFAAAACFYFWKSQGSESNASKFRDEVLSLQDRVDSLTAEKEKLQASMSDSVGQLKTREEFLDEKEAKLAQQEARIEAGIPKAPPAPVQPPKSTAVVPKKFSDTITTLAKVDGADVITRGGRPILRLPNTSFFAPGDSSLKPDGQSDYFELRIESYTDSDTEAGATDTPAKGDQKKDAPAKGDAAKTHFANAWDLTSARATVIERYYRDQTSMPFQNVLVSARGDSLPIASSAKDKGSNRRIEISLAPLPAAFHTDTSAKPDAPATPPKPAKSKDKDKDADKDKPKDKDKNKDKSPDKPKPATN